MAREKKWQAQSRANDARYAVDEACRKIVEVAIAANEQRASWDDVAAAVDDFHKATKKREEARQRVKEMK